MGDWITLFDGKTLNGWKATANADGWTVENGCIKCLAQKGGYLASDGKFEDFVLELEYKTEADANSGIFFHWSDLKDPVHTGLEIQILDTYGKTPIGKQDSGALYDLVPPAADAAKPTGEWNQIRLECNGPMIHLDQNGQRILDVDINTFDTAGKSPDGTDNKFKYAWKNMPRLGHIGLQDHNGVLWFRSLRIREL